MRDNWVKKLIWIVLIVIGMAFILYGCRATEPQLKHCYNHTWQDVLVVDLPKGGYIIINGKQFVIPARSEIIITGNETN